MGSLRDEATGEVRWMCAWDTTEEDVEEFAAAVVEECARASSGPRERAAR